MLGARLNPPPSDLCRYMRRCMVQAACPALSANTLAARPVGAISTTLQPSCFMVRTIAPATDVLPVPADPRIIISTRSERSVMKAANVRMADSCSAVGSKPSFSAIIYVSSSAIIILFSSLFTCAMKASHAVAAYGRSSSALHGLLLTAHAKLVFLPDIRLHRLIKLGENGLCTAVFTKILSKFAYY